MNHREIKQLAEYRVFLCKEIEELKTRVKFQDTGHIKSAISILRARVREIDRRKDGYFDWKDEYLFGS
jgi:hypothetical protein